jgi:hypothetical protein
MKFKFLTCFLAVSLVYSCADRSPNKAEENKTPARSLPLNKPPSTFPDTLKINFTAAVFYSPDSLQLQKIRSLTDPSVYEANMHEYFYLVKTAHLAIKKDLPQLRIIEAINVRYLLFINADKTENCIDLDKKFDPYGLFLFDRKAPPHFVDMANIETELGFYFSK